MAAAPPGLLPKDVYIEEGWTSRPKSSPSLGAMVHRFLHLGWARGACVLELLTIKKNISLKPPTLLVGR